MTPGQAYVANWPINSWPSFSNHSFKCLSRWSWHVQILGQNALMEIPRCNRLALSNLLYFHYFKCSIQQRYRFVMIWWSLFSKMDFVLKIARQNNVPFHPYLLALASSADTGSSTTPIRNPQNLVIVIQSGISAGQFPLGLVPALLVGIVVTALILLCMYWKVLSVEKVEEDAFAEWSLSFEFISFLGNNAHNYVTPQVNAEGMISTSEAPGLQWRYESGRDS